MFERLFELVDLCNKGKAELEQLTALGGPGLVRPRDVSYDPYAPSVISAST